MLFFIISCNTVYSEKTEFKNNTWNYNDNVNFHVNIIENTNLYNVYIDIENNDLYKYSNLYLFISLKSPENKIKTDTVDVILADYRGKWFGDKSNDVYKGHFLYRKAVSFPAKGTYIFSVKQGMRNDNLQGISSIGISIEKCSNN